MSEVTMPRLSDTMEEGVIARWLKQPGDTIKKGDILAEIETDKATMDLESFDTGVLEQILVKEGDTVPIGQPVAIIGSGDNVQLQGQPPAPQQGQEQSKTSAAAREEDVAAPGSPQDTAQVRQEAEQTSASTQQQKAAPATPAAPVESSSDGRLIKASPLARRMAEEHRIDLSQVHGTGPGGRIVRDDIDDILEQQPTPTPAAAAQQPQAVPAAPAQTASQPAQPAIATAPSAPEMEITPLSRVQMLIAKRLTESKQTIPHFYVSNEVDMTDALAVRQTLNANAGEGGAKVTVNDLIVKACALALEKFPEVNSSYKDGQLIHYKRIHVGFAVDVPSGLVVPVIRDANIKGVRVIAREAKALIEKARANKLTTSDLEGGTFSVSNLGMMDVTGFLAVINPPQAAILAIASTRKQFVPIDDQPVTRDLMSMTMSADHRILYGATVARFLQEVKRLLQSPYTLLG